MGVWETLWEHVRRCGGVGCHETLWGCMGRCGGV